MHYFGRLHAMPCPHTDLDLSRRLERAEALAGAKFVESRARIDPACGAQWINIVRAWAMFDGPRSPATQTFGLGLFQIPTPEEMECIEGFFRDRDAPPFHEVSPLADRSMLPLLAGRGYRPVELTSVMFQSIERRDTSASGVQVRIARAAEFDLWAQTAAQGWNDSIGFADLMLGLAQVVAASENNYPFLAEIEGQPVATGSLIIHDGVALLAGASTVPEFRRRGAQGALLDARLNFAASTGCDLAMMCAEPGSASQRNAERQGFRIAYTRIKWGLA
jgi:GNAT superfamily N-acetyltransferase